MRFRCPQHQHDQHRVWRRPNVPNLSVIWPRAEGTEALDVQRRDRAARAHLHSTRGKRLISHSLTRQIPDCWRFPRRLGLVARTRRRDGGRASVESRGNGSAPADPLPERDLGRSVRPKGEAGALAGAAGLGRRDTSKFVSRRAAPACENPSGRGATLRLAWKTKRGVGKSDPSSGARSPPCGPPIPWTRRRGVGGPPRHSECAYARPRPRRPGDEQQAARPDATLTASSHPADRRNAFQTLRKRAGCRGRLPLCALLRVHQQGKISTAR